MSQMSDRRPNRRATRTRDDLQKAMGELAAKSGFEAVTVSMIVRRARVNRSTFYRHFLNKQDMLEQHLETLQRDVVAAIRQADRLGRGYPTEQPAGLVCIIKHVQEHALLFSAMFRHQGGDPFVGRFRELSERRHRHLLTEFGSRRERENPVSTMRLKYVSAAIVGVLAWWLENNQPLPVEQLALELSQINCAVSGLRGKLGAKSSA